MIERKEEEIEELMMMKMSKSPIAFLNFIRRRVTQKARKFSLFSSDESGVPRRVRVNRLPIASLQEIHQLYFFLACKERKWAMSCHFQMPVFFSNTQQVFFFSFFFLPSVCTCTYVCICLCVCDVERGHLLEEMRWLCLICGSRGLSSDSSLGPFAALLLCIIKESPRSSSSSISSLLLLLL